MAAGHFGVLTFHFIARCVFYVYTHAGRTEFFFFFFTCETRLEGRKLIG